MRACVKSTWPKARHRLCSGIKHENILNHASWTIRESDYETVVALETQVSLHKRSGTPEDWVCLLPSLGKTQGL